ncbi:MAG TPA: VOC family protein [Stellaceae bacterium]|nr:VOC family protein [Stellaceae bacterium]
MAKSLGRFIWYDVMTSDTKTAAKFYGDVIGWTAQSHPTADGGAYTIFSKGSARVAGLMAIPDAMRAEGVSPCWNGYISSQDVDADTNRVVKAGGAVRRAPLDIPDVGRFAVVADPGGAVFLLFKPNRAEEFEPAAPMTAGHIGWHELVAGDVNREFSFYSKLFGWTKERAHDMGPMGVYQTFAMGGAPSGGMMKTDGKMPPAWGYYLAVASVTKALERARKQGATLLYGPAEVPGGAWIVQARDPQGAHFAMVSPGK